MAQCPKRLQACAWADSMDNGVAPHPKEKTQAEQLLKILERNQSVQEILERAKGMGMPHWYLGAGGIAQTVWNEKHGLDPEHGIKDYDLVYYDDADLSYEAEDVFIRKGKEAFRNIPVLVEIRNQARVHLWYERHFGKSIEPYQSAEQAIGTWPTTATAVGIRKNMNGKIQVFAPFGLDDLLGLVVRANKAQITPKIYQDKVNRWTKIWPGLNVIPWNGE